MEFKRLFLLFIFFKTFISEYFESMEVGSISDNASIIDITDYNNLYLLITTEKYIYTGMPPNKASETQSKIMNISAAVTYDNNYILLACSENYLLSIININSRVEMRLLNYEDAQLTIEYLNYSCSICFKNNISYIGIPQIIENSLVFSNCLNF